jgi:hypothetical protein
MRTIVLVAATLAALPLTSIDALRRWTVVCPRHQRRHQLRISHLRASAEGPAGLYVHIASLRSPALVSPFVVKYSKRPRPIPLAPVRAMIRCRCPLPGVQR